MSNNWEWKEKNGFGRNSEEWINLVIRSQYGVKDEPKISGLSDRKDKSTNAGRQMGEIMRLIADR